LKRYVQLDRAQSAGVSPSAQAGGPIEALADRTPQVKVAASPSAQAGGPIEAKGIAQAFGADMSQVSVGAGRRPH
jgi:hypothetical protein